MDDEKPIEGDIVEEEYEPVGDDAPLADKFWGAYVFPARPFGELLKVIRARISESVGHEVTQEEFGALLGGGVNQVTISRWQRGKQVPQVAQLEKIVALGLEYDIHGLTLARLQESLRMDVAEWANIDPRVTELNTLLLLEDETYRTGFFNVVFALHYLLRGAVRAIRRGRD